MKIRTNALAGIALAATAALGLAACGSGSSSTAGSSAAANGSAAGEITVYNAQHESLTKEWIDAFTAETGIKVTVRQGLVLQTICPPNIVCNVVPSQYCTLKSRTPH